MDCRIGAGTDEDEDGVIDPGPFLRKEGNRSTRSIPMKLKRVLIALVLAPVLAACQSSGSGPEPEPRGTEDRRGY